MRREFDVAVVGGGSAGVAAAIAAAARGARTVLIERNDELGGNISQAFVHTICGLYFHADEKPARPANPGFPMRFARALLACGAASGPVRAGRVWVLAIDPARLPAVAAECCSAVDGLEVVCGVELVGCELSGSPSGAQQLLLRDHSGGTFEVLARIAIDASGDAAAATLGGAETRISAAEALQLPSFIFRLAGVEADALEELQGFGRLLVTRAVAGAVRDGVLPPGCESVLVRPGFEPGSVYVTLNVPRPTPTAWDPADSEALAAVQASAQTSAERLVDYLRESRAAFASCRVERWPARLGVREGRRLAGRCEVVGDDVRTGRRRDDEVAVSTWPIELWRDHRRAQFEYPDGPCSVPLGALLSRSHPGLAMAGRCLGADADALGALRVIGTALATGEAAGVAAALAADARIGLPEVAAAAVRAHIQERAMAHPHGPDIASEDRR